nr:unnamed protein product [Callosobruchus analis]
MDGYIRHYEDVNIKTTVTQTLTDCNEKLDRSTANFNVFHNNIRSISKNLDELKVLLHEISIEFQCIILTETFHIPNKELFELPGYTLIYNESEINKNDGVVVYIKSKLNFCYKILEIGKIKAVNLLVQHPNQKINILAIYRSPSLCPTEFLVDFDTLFKREKFFDINIVVGDINIDILDDTHHSNEYLNILRENNFVSMINEYTRVQGESRSCIDHIFLRTNKCYEVFQPLLLKYTITGHYPTILQFLVTHTKTAKSKTDIRQKYKTYINYNNLRAKLKNHNWSEIYEKTDANEAVDLFINILKLSIGECTTKIKLKKWEVARSKWMTSGLLKSIHRKSELYKDVLKSPDNNELLTYFKKYRNHLSNTTKHAKEIYFRSKIEQNKCNNTLLWQCLKEATNRNKKKVEITGIKMKNGTQLTSKTDMANEFLEYFTHIGPSLAGKIKQTKKYEFTSNSTPNSIVLLPTSKDEIIKIISQLQTKKAAGCDQIRNETIKQIAEHISEPLCFIFNLCIDGRQFPEAFKTAIVIPIFKSGGRTEPKNYRPISFLPSLSKIFEKILKVRIVSYIRKYKLVSEFQYGFLEGRSTEDAMTELLSNIYLAIDNKVSALGVFVDLAKAFDTVNHVKLLDLLQAYGFRGNVLSLMRTYISGRKQRVNIDGVLSGTEDMICGVPQDSVVGPILFILYINNTFFGHFRENRELC